MNAELLAEVRERATDRCDKIAETLLGKPTFRSRQEWRWRTHGSFSLALSGQKRGLWHDHETREGGDIIALVQRECGCDFSQAIDWLAEYFHIQPTGNAPAIRPRERPKPSAPAAQPNSDLAARIWRDSRDPHGTFAETYLASRGLALPIEVRAVIRFHAACPWEGATAPAMVAAFMPIAADIPDDPFLDPPITAIHRIRGRGHVNKKMLGPVGGKAIMLSPWWHVYATLHVCEGLETALALYGLYHRPIWALGSAGAIATLPIVSRVRRLIIWADNDESGVSVNAARKCADRWTESGRDVVIRYPDQADTDYADRIERLHSGGH